MPVTSAMAHQWIAQLFHRGSRPGFDRQVVVHRPLVRAKPPVRKVVVHRNPRPVVRRVAYRYPAYYERPVVRQVVYRPYPVVYDQLIVRRVVYRRSPAVYHRPVFVQRRCFLPERYLCG